MRKGGLAVRGRPSSCAFTGHRPAKLPWGYREEDPRCLALKRRIRDAVESAYEEGYCHFLCGMAQGCDLYFCEIVLLTDCFTAKVPHKELFMAYCFGPLYILLGLSYLLEA